jgi:hypothetical protein
MTSETTYCARHADVATNLRCGRCEELICPGCLVHVPVGVRCPECAQTQTLPTFDVTGAYLARAIAAGVVLGVVGGVVGGVVLGLLLGLPFLGPIVIVAVGYLAGEGISMAANRKRGRSLKYVAAGSVIISVLTISLVSIGPMTIFDLLAGAYAVYVAVNRF